MKKISKLLFVLLMVATGYFVASEDYHDEDVELASSVGNDDSDYGDSEYSDLDYDADDDAGMDIPRAEQMLIHIGLEQPYENLDREQMMERIATAKKYIISDLKNDMIMFKHWHSYKHDREIEGATNDKTTLQDHMRDYQAAGWIGALYEIWGGFNSADETRKSKMNDFKNYLIAKYPFLSHYLTLDPKYACMRSVAMSVYDALPEIKDAEKEKEEQEAAARHEQYKREMGRPF